MCTSCSRRKQDATRHNVTSYDNWNSATILSSKLFYYGLELILQVLCLTFRYHMKIYDIKRNKSRLIFKANTCNNFFAFDKYLMDPTVKFVNRAHRDSHSIKSFCNRPLMSDVIKRRYLSHSHHNVLRQSWFWSC